MKAVVCTRYGPPARTRSFFLRAPSWERTRLPEATRRSGKYCKGYVIVDEFACKEFNTDSFLKYIGGMNRGRPNAEELKNAEEFALNMMQELQN
jgi:hypothetical protein